MIMLDETENLILAAAAAKGGVDSTVVADEFTQTTMAVDSIGTVLKDSIRNMDVADLKAVVTGENSIVKDALGGLMDIAVAFVPKLLGCIVVLWVGFKLIKLLKRFLGKVLSARNAERSLAGFLLSFVDVLLKVLLIIMAMDVIGVRATSFIAILGAVGLAVGMAMQGTLQNFAGGVIILLLKPFKVGDYIECGDCKGYVKSISIFNTTIRPFNGRNIIVPNSDLATKTITNHTKEEVIRLDVVASVAYGTDLGVAKEVIGSVVAAEELVLKDPEPTICVTSLGSSSVDFGVWMWVKVEDYWTVWKRFNENLYNAMNANGIQIPFPQMDVHLRRDKDNQNED